ncbi:BREX system ATP-binding domain-containing protein [Actinoplanes solisilvae]|uniref:BREX system ATP-binding domain-containing protein n=1 Tax=Actinoplanes solisilvae TaxID=2486853 RepID=UPI000FDC3A57|nr:LuxR family transcriptional regulator [Actinoplanes solisilvae]
MAANPSGLFGRRQERAALDRLLKDVSGGSGRVLVMRGEAGSGKTALISYVSARAQKLQVLPVAGVESEQEMPYGGLHQLLAPLLGHLERLPAPQCEALSTVFGLNTGPMPDRLMVGLATLTLLAEASTDRPLICLVDNVQWLDSTTAYVLSFVARRLSADAVGLLCATRENGEDVLSGLPTLFVRGLSDADARALLLRTVHGSLDAAVLDQIVAESHGNPLALLELPRTLADLAGGFGLPGTRSVAGRIEESYGRRIGRLPPGTRLLMLTAAADPLGDPVLLDRAARTLGADPAELAPAVDEGLVEVHRRVVFAHPLVRAAAYRYTDLDDRYRVHRALAEATDPVTAPDRRAWHRARAAAEPDEGVAAELESSVGRAQSRAGLAAAAAFLSRSAELTPDPAARARRGLDAAFAGQRAGAFDLARRLLVLVLAGPLDPTQQARADLLRAHLAEDPVPRLLAVARRLEPLDARLAREAYLDAVVAAQSPAGRRHGPGLASVARAARSAAFRSSGGSTELILDAFGALADSSDTAAPLAREAFAALRSVPPAARELGQGAMLALAWWDDQEAYGLSDRYLRAARSTGALSELPPAVGIRAAVLLLSGEPVAAAALVEEVAAPDVALLLAAWNGQKGDDQVGAPADYARALLGNGTGRHGDALEAARRAADDPVVRGHALSELVEAAVRSDQASLAAPAVAELAQRARAAGTDWALGMAALAGAQLDGNFAPALECLGRTRVRPALARAHLLHGEWLGRSGKRADAGTSLALAYEMFTALGMTGFADRARRELLAAGSSAPQTRLREDLTEQEAQIAQMAREGLSNPEIGAKLFLSARTVEWHMRKVFTKLGISSRRQLRSLPG